MDGVAIHDVRDSGHWYDFGIVLGAIIVFGGPAGNRRGRSTAASKTGAV